MRAILLTLAVGAFALGVAAPANASSSYSSCDTGANRWTETRGGYGVALDRYQGRRMACSSVRYVINQWLRPKVARQYGWPRVARPFYDGYVRWSCWKLSGYTVQCDEYTSNTSLRFNARVG